MDSVSKVSENADCHEKWMHVALEEARLALAEGEVPVGAVVVRGGEVLSRSHNRREQSGDSTAHAEMLAIREASAKIGSWRLKECTLYVTLEPCPMCAGAMVVSQLSRCVFGAYDCDMGCCGSVYDFSADPAFHSKLVWIAGCCEKECSSIISEFFASKR